MRYTQNRFAVTNFRPALILRHDVVADDGSRLGKGTIGWLVNADPATGDCVVRIERPNEIEVVMNAADINLIVGGSVALH